MKRQLTASERRRLTRLVARIESQEARREEAHRELAEFVATVGQAAVARELGISRQALAYRLRRYSD